MWIIAVITITAFSCSSFLYEINPWSDANIFLTIGRGIIDGKIVYADLFDHKGPILYFIYALAAIISNTSFFGVYLLEVICMFFFLYYSFKIYRLFYDQEDLAIYFYLLFMAIIIATSSAFSYGGGSVEELFLPILQANMYYVLKTIKCNEDFSALTCLTLGIFTGIAFFVKYTICGFYLGLFIYCLSYQYTKDKYKILNCIINATAGFLIPTILTVAYFLIVGELLAFIQGYFVTNINGYASWDVSIFKTLFMLVKGILWYLKNNIVLLSLSLLGLFSTHYHSKLFKCCIITFICWYIVSFIGGVYIHYYILPISIYMIYAYSIIKKIRIKNYLYAIISIILIIQSQNIRLIGEKDTIQEMVVSEMYEYVNEPKFIMYHGYDEGFYLQANIIPACKYFTQINAKNHNYDEDTINCINENDFDFIISMNELIDIDGYELLQKFSNLYDGHLRYYNLYINENLLRG